MASPLTRNQFYVLVLLLPASLVLELAVYLRFPGLDWLTPRLWLATALTIALVIVVRGVRQLFRDIRQRQAMPVGVFLLAAGLLLWPFFDRSRGVIGQDATQQLAAGLAAFQEPDWHFTGQAFLDYPSRQYLLAALPAQLLGRTETALRIGFAWPLWLGLILFSDSLRCWARDKGLAHGDSLALAILTAVFVFPYVTEYYLYFEHTLFPFCFFLQAIGWLLHFMRKPGLFHALALAWTGSMLIHCYTTALAAVLLLVILLAAFFIAGRLPGRLKDEPAAAKDINPAKNPFFSWSCLLIALTVTLALTLSVVFGRGDRATLLRSREIQVLLSAALDGLKIALLHDPAVYASFYLPFIWLYLAAGLTFMLGRLHAAIAAWTAGVIVLSQILQGYAVYPAPVSFSRTLITIPALLAAWFILAAGQAATTPLGRWTSRPHRSRLRQARFTLDFRKALLAGLILLNLCGGLYHIGKPVVQGDAAKYFYPGPLQKMQLLVSDLNQRAGLEKLAAHDTFTFILYTDNVWLKNPADYTGYFFPEARVAVLASGSPLPEDLDWHKPVLIYIMDGVPGDVPQAGRLIECSLLQLAPEQSVPLQRVIFSPVRQSGG